MATHIDTNTWKMDWILLIINYVPLPIFLFYRIGGVDTLYFRCNIGFCSNSALRENGISKCEDVRFLLLIQMSRFVHIYWKSVCYLFLFSSVVNVFISLIYICLIIFFFFFFFFFFSFAV